MATNTNITLVGLDFDTLKTNLKNYLKNNTAFKDVNFEGSNINMLLEILAYNTYLNGFYTNMVASEMFLDTAQLKDSIISHAKELNYVPKSYSSSKAVINITITPSTSVSSILIPKGTSFTSKVGSNSYSFSTNENIVLNNPDENGKYSTQLNVYEGSYVTDTFVYNSNAKQRFVLSNPTVDTSTIVVTTIENSGSTIKTYLRASSLYGVDSNSLVYFIQAAENGQYEITFGDNIFGKSPPDGSTIVIEYKICSGELPNGAETFINDGPIDSQTNITITTVEKATSGSVSESIESIRFNAPRAVATQERAVTTNDYKTLMRVQFPEIQAINVYGGEDADPPQYGKVFLSIDIFNADGVPDANKRVYLDFIRPRMPLTISAEIVDPEFTYIDVNTTVRYNVNVSQKSLEEIKTLVQAAINDYNTVNLNDFEATLRYSQLVKAIDNTDTSIVSNETSVRVLKMLSIPELEFNVNKSYVIKFDIPLSEEYYITASTFSAKAQHTITTSLFTYEGKTCLIMDNESQLNIVTQENETYKVVKPIGTVDYSTGTIQLNDFRPDSAPSGRIKFYAVPASKDIFCRRNTILSIQEEDINISVERVRE